MVKILLSCDLDFLKLALPLILFLKALMFWILDKVPGHRNKAYDLSRLTGDINKLGGRELKTVILIKSYTLFSIKSRC